MDEQILIVEDEFIIAGSLKLILEEAGYKVQGIATSVPKALDMIRTKRPAWVFLDIYLSGKQTGIDLARQLLEMHIPFIYVSANSNHSILMEAKTTRPYGFLVKPFREQDVLVTLEIAKYRYEHDIAYQLKSARTLKDEEDMGMIGSAANFRQVKDQIANVAPFDVSVLILGESGTGKEKVAQAIHHLSERSNKPLIKVNCAAIPATLIEAELFGHEKGAFTGAMDRRIGKFEQANGGTVFLDEIGEIPLDLQVKLLCVLQEKEIVRLGSNEVIKTDIRIIAATNRNLEKGIAEGNFRLDLYYRLNVFPVIMPPLRERKEDIPALVNHFIDSLSAKMRIAPKQITDTALQLLLNYEWPGNIRELENIIERSLVLNKGNVIEHINLPVLEKNDPVISEVKVKTIREMEKEHILATLALCNGRISGADGAAKLLDISPTTLIARLKKLGITKDIVP